MKRLFAMIAVIAGLALSLPSPARAQEEPPDEIQDSGPRLGEEEARRILAQQLAPNASRPQQVDYYQRRERAAFTLGEAAARIEALRQLVPLTEAPDKLSPYVGYLWRELWRYGSQTEAAGDGRGARESPCSHTPAAPYLDRQPRPGLRDHRQTQPRGRAAEAGGGRGQGSSGYARPAHNRVHDDCHGRTARNRAERPERLRGRVRRDTAGARCQPRRGEARPRRRGVSTDESGVRCRHPAAQRRNGYGGFPLLRAGAQRGGRGDSAARAAACGRGAHGWRNRGLLARTAGARPARRAPLRGGRRRRERGLDRPACQRGRGKLGAHCHHAGHPAAGTISARSDGRMPTESPPRCALRRPATGRRARWSTTRCCRPSCI